MRTRVARSSTGTTIDVSFSGLAIVAALALAAPLALAFPVYSKGPPASSQSHSVRRSPDMHESA
jgi:hypothetical protein